MSKKKSFRNERSGTRNNILRDVILRSLIATGEPIEFRPLFDVMAAAPEIREAYPSANDELLRLRFYEQLQNMTERGYVNRDKRTYAVTAHGRKEWEIAEAAKAELPPEAPDAG